MNLLEEFEEYLKNHNTSLFTKENFFKFMDEKKYLLDLKDSVYSLMETLSDLNSRLTTLEREFMDHL